MISATDNHLFPAPAVGKQRRQVAHRSAGDEKGLVFPQQFSDPFLKPIDAGVFAVDVVAELGFVHRAAHAIVRLGDSVASQVQSRRVRIRHPGQA